MTIPCQSIIKLSMMSSKTESEFRLTSYDMTRSVTAFSHGWSPLRAIPIHLLRPVIL